MIAVQRIRSFLNTDTPQLSKLWTAHHAAVQSRSACSVSVWDQCILSKPFFDRDELLVAVTPDELPVGFIHFGFAGNSQGTRASETESLIHKICVAPSPDEDAIGLALLTRALDSLRSRGAKTCTSLGCMDHNAFYLGVGDGDHLMGVVARDARTQRWLNQSGFIPTRPTESWDLDLSSFRPPMDRTQISIRRTCTVGRLLDEDSNQWWLSSVFGHCEQIRFNLVLRSPPRVENELMFWYPDPTISGVDGSVVRLWMPTVPESEEVRERFIYLMAESLRQLQQDRKHTVRAYACADQQSTVSMLQRLGFRSTEHGMIYSIKLA